MQRTEQAAGALVATGYMTGFGNELATEALPGALPVGRNSPQRCPYGLYAEQISGTAFSAPRASNRRSWLYRIRPAAVLGPFEPFAAPGLAADEALPPTPPEPLRWDPLPLPQAPADFVEGLLTMAVNGDPRTQSGCAIHLYACNRPMADRYFYSADGELLIVPQQGRLRLATELGVIEAEPQEIVVIPRGIRFAATPLDGAARGYVAENHGQPLQLPERGVIGANGLANARDFLTPVAAWEDREAPGEIVAKFMGRLWRAATDRSPLDVLAWHGNHAPCKYDLRRYNALGSISYDHPDPSLLAVLQSPSDTPGVAALDFVVFPPRVLVAEGTFRPPWFHRNVASEFMGLIRGAYDAKAGGFVPGGASLHNCMSGHGPDAASVERALQADTGRPEYLRGTMAFMFETRWVLRPTRQALESPQRQRDYHRCWQTLPLRFDPARR